MFSPFKKNVLQVYGAWEKNKIKKEPVILDNEMDLEKYPEIK